MRVEIEYDQEKQIATCTTDADVASIPIVKGPQKFYVDLDTFGGPAWHIVGFGVEYP